MTLTPGTRLGPYQIVAPLGSGGMGEVYEAKDTRLDRTVAIKVLPATLAADEASRERFEREARAISSLQHPNICALFDVGEAAQPANAAEELGASAEPLQPIRFLVLEYLQGETLAARLNKAVLIPAAEALRLAIEICEALDAAHRRGIVHRDLKPANVFLVRSSATSGRASAKLLDFGLAKTATPVVATSGLSMLPTTPPTLTAQGTILGTFQYMAPEQIEGVEADVRSDLFAFGAVLFEMLTGRTAFEGKTRATLLGAILKDNPPAPSSLQPSLSKAFDRIIVTCLAKDPDERWQSARDVLHELRWIASDGAHETNLVPVASVPNWRRRWVSLLAVAALSGAVGVVLTMWMRTAPDASPLQFTIAAPVQTTFATPPGGGTGLAPQLALSPDGKHLVFVASGVDGFRLWLRSFVSAETRPIAGTEGAAFPFWSPDSRYVAFFADGKLKKVTLSGAPPVPLCDAPSGRGGTWNQNNVIVFSPSTGGGLQRVAAAGGVPIDAASLDQEYGETSHRFPFFLPDGRHFVYTAVVGTCCPAPKPGRIKIGALDSTDTTILLEMDSAATYADGHLLYHQGSTNALMARPFSAKELSFLGEPFPIAQAVAAESSRYASFSVSTNGVLAYLQGDSRPTSTLTWFDRSGQQLSSAGNFMGLGGMGLSPDERRAAVAISIGAPLNRDIYLIDTATGAQSRVTFDDADDDSPTWFADSERIIFSRNRGGVFAMFEKSLNSASSETVLFEQRPGAGGPIYPNDISPDGRLLVFHRSQATAGSTDVWVMPLSGDRKAVPYLQSVSFESDAAFSPDGKWVAYQNAEFGRLPDVFVQPYPATGGKFQVSQGGGYKPRWRADGKELFFLSGNSDIMAASVDTSRTFQAGVPIAVMSGPVIGINSIGRQYGVTRDGKRFLLNVRRLQSSTKAVTVTINWLETVQR